jgi:hypothetical protein
MINEL